MLRLRLRFVQIGCIVVSSTLASVGSSAAGAVPGPAGLSPQTAAACSLSVGTARTTSFIWTPPEELTSMAWRIPACATCGGAGLKVKTLSFRMRWFGPCTAQAQILVVGARQGADCLEPDTTIILCPPASYPITGVGNASVTYTLPFAADCCILGNAFALVRFSGLGGCASATVSPGLASSTTRCTSCDQFVTASNLYPTFTEWCSIGATNETWFALEADCCTATPTQRKTWGSLKTTYH